MSIRRIIHIDLDAFYASVEQRDNPKLQGKPIVVGGDPSGRGVVSTASYEARKFGVRSAMSSAKAKMLCPNLIFVRPSFEKYKEASQIIRKIFHEATDLVEPLSLDEAYLDVTENKLNEASATKIASYLKARIKGQVGLTASAGVASNKFLAKIASDYKKPNGLFVIRPEQIEAFVEKLPVEMLWGVGPATTKKLKKYSLHTTADIRNFPELHLKKIMGSYGDFIIRLSNGIDTREVNPNREMKSRGSETTFAKDKTNLNEIYDTLTRLCEEVSESLIKHNIFGRTLTVKVRYHDFKTITRSQSFSTPFRDYEHLFNNSKSLLNEKTEIGMTPIRLIGVAVSQFQNKSEQQLSFEL